MSCQLKFMITCKMLRATTVHLKMLPAISVSFLLQQPLNKGKYLSHKYYIKKLERGPLAEVLCRVESHHPK